MGNFLVDVAFMATRGLVRKTSRAIYGALRRRKRVKELGSFPVTPFSWAPSGGDPAMIDYCRRNVGGSDRKYYAHRFDSIQSTNYRGLPVAAIRYGYSWREVEGDISNERDAYHDVVFLRLPAPRPRLKVTLEDVNGRMHRDLQLESIEFNKKFDITTENNRFAYDILHPRMMQWLLEDPRSNWFEFGFDAHYLASWEARRVDEPLRDLKAGFLIEIINQVPAFVWRM